MQARPKQSELDVDELREALHDAPAHAHDHDGDLASHSVIAQETKRQYYAIALGVLTVLEPEEEFDFEDNAEEVERYPDYERAAIEEIHEARTGVDRTPQCAALTGLQRKDRLEDALIRLQPILSLGRESDFFEAHPIQAELEKLILQVREQIDRDILLEERFGSAPAKIVEEDEDGDGNPQEPPPGL